LTEVPTQAGSGFVPTAEDRASVEAWFARYDELTAKADVAGMADMAMFPLNMATDDSAGKGSATQCGREEFVRDMTGAVGEGARMESVRTPHFLTGSLVFVITDAKITANGETQHVRYGDLLVKNDGQWFFQTMVQGGWG